MESKCDCPAACNVTTYNADLSYAALSLDGIDSLLSDDRDEIQRKHVVAKELQERVKSSSIIDTLQKLERIDKTVAQFNEIWKSKIERVETSLVYRIIDALVQSIYMANADINQLYQKLPEYIKFYDDNLRMERMWLDDCVKKIELLVKDASTPIMAKCDWQATHADISFLVRSADQYAEAVELLSNSQSFIHNYGSLATYKHLVKSLSFDGNSYLPTHSVAEKASQDICANNISYSKLLEIVTPFANRLSIPLLNFVSCKNALDMDEKTFYNRTNFFYVSLKKLEKNLSPCLNEYPDYLRSTNQWKNENEMSPSIR